MTIMEKEIEKFIERLNKESVLVFSDSSHVDEATGSAEAGCYGQTIKVFFPNVFSSEDPEPDYVDFYDNFAVLIYNIDGEEFYLKNAQGKPEFSTLEEAIDKINTYARERITITINY